MPGTATAGIISFLPFCCNQAAARNAMNAENPLFQAFSPIPVQGSTYCDCIKDGMKIDAWCEAGGLLHGEKRGYTLCNRSKIWYECICNPETQSFRDQERQPYPGGMENQSEVINMPVDIFWRCLQALFYGLQHVEIELIFPNGNMSRVKQKTTRYAGESQIVIQLRSPLSIKRCPSHYLKRKR